jgi:pyruvate kinase
MLRKTKIICTLGPASSSTATLEKMILAGMNVARLNFSHGDHQSQLDLVNNLRAAEKKTKQTVILLQDLQGPKIRLGILPENGVAIKLKENFILDTSSKTYTEKNNLKIIPVQYRHLHKDVSKNDLILIEDGMIQTKVIKVSGTSITVQAITPGLLKSHKGINVPTASISANPLTPKDLADLKFGLKLGVDYVALSFVRKASDIEKLRQIIHQAKSTAKIVAKIERHEALDNLEEIIQASDAIMVARGDLGVETPAVEVPIAQKIMVKMAIISGKPVIIATEMLQSIVNNPRATRAEISDAANAVFDHSDGLMLSNETASGKYPVEAVVTLAKVSEAMEKFQKNQQWTKLNHQNLSENDSSEICLQAAKLAEETKADKIIAITNHGFTARQLAKLRSFTEIITITPNLYTSRELRLSWGLNKILVNKANNSKDIIALLKKEKLIKKGEKIVIVSNASLASREIMLKQI